ncbi:hypothetical protein EVJ32_05065 [Exiguobacterium sp. SH5S4]|uniref:hypothetical protein n=1 Tax=Exiguobacterium sp. SH5S4 TaxID=2510961 RepID=UPI00103F126D|nr:hypothetical protein [Exiguobacterium sp. SH5S4]TCI26748.1 hypothetical protein EVJ32_05065 [Exiguobacterium sp. SH5S4]
MLKQLLKNYPQVASLKQRKHKTHSELPEAMKLKVLKSWSKGGGRVLFCRLNAITEDEYKLIVKDVVSEAKHTGRRIQISPKITLSEGILYLFGHISERYNPHGAIDSLGLTRSMLRYYKAGFEDLSGERVEIRLKTKERQYFRMIDTEYVYISPSTGKPMNVLDSSTFYSDEIKSTKMKSGNIEAVLFCKDSLREFMLYKGDKNTPKGTYEFRFEFLTDTEQRQEIAS